MLLTNRSSHCLVLGSQEGEDPWRTQEGATRMCESLRQTFCSSLLFGKGLRERRV
jgi:hypothetical protein